MIHSPFFTFFGTDPEASSNPVWHLGRLFLDGKQLLAALHQNKLFFIKLLSGTDLCFSLFKKPVFFFLVNELCILPAGTSCFKWQ